MAEAVAEAVVEPTRPVSLGFQVLLSLANAGAMITLIPVLTVLIPAQVTQVDPVRPASSLALVLTLGAAAALVGNPLAGALSDRTTSRFGRRRPWLVIGTIGTGLGLSLLSVSSTVFVLACAWFLVQLFGNVLLSSYGAVLPDYVPVRQRGTTQAIIGLSTPAAIILSDLFFTQVRDIRSVYPLLIAVQALLALLFVLFYQEARLPRECLPPFHLRAFLASFWVSPRRYPVFSRGWLMWFLVWLGYNLGTGGFFFLYVQNITRFESLFPGLVMKDGIALVQILQISVGVPLMLAAGVISDRSGKRREFVSLGIFMIAAGLVMLVYFSAWRMVLAASILMGAGFWLFYSLGLAMISQILPSASERGKHLGVINIAATLPQVIMPAAGAALINAFGDASPIGYKLLFGLAALSVLLGVLVIRSIQK